MERVKVKDKFFKKYLDADIIDAKVEQLALRIRQDYKDKCPLFLVVINGAIVFAADLIRKANIDCEYDCMRAQSYGDAMTTSGSVKISGTLPKIEGRDILIVEDIVDTGHTLHALTKHLQGNGAKSIEIVALFSKPTMRQVELEVKYVGFDIDPHFIVGYGLDYAHRGRYLKHIYILDQNQ